MAQVATQPGMSTIPAKAGSHRDVTFRNYTPSLATAYAAARSNYPEALIKIVLDAHTSSGGHLDSLIDIGCGPGIATRQLAPYFQDATGADPGEAMIHKAHSIESQLQPPVTTASGSPIRFEICAAESIHSLLNIAPNSIDLITAATAAHWFDMPDFYRSAAQVLKPGGSIILFGFGQFFCDPKVTPNGAEVQRIWHEMRDNLLGPYQTPGNLSTLNLYRDLPMPWQIAVQTDDEMLKGLMDGFDEAASSQLRFNEDGKPDERFENGYLRYRKANLEQMRPAIETGSQVTRWREAHKEQLERGEVEDVVDAFVRVTRETMEKVPEGKGVDEIGAGFGAVVLVIKKKAA